MSFSQDAAREIGELKRRLERLETYDAAYLNISCRVYADGNWTHGSSGNWLTLDYNQERWDTDTMHDTSTNNDRITIQRPGVYSLWAGIAWDGNAVGSRMARFTLGGVGTIAAKRRFIPGSSEVYMTLDTIYQFSAGDYVTCDVWQDTGGSLDIIQYSNWSPEFTAARIA